jgi:MarR family 2-MHQ and catechol resistance regulon transcriptional repressor
MPAFTPNKDQEPDFITLMRTLAGAHQAIAMYDAAIHRDSGLGLTPSQADVIFTLGGTEGMTCADISAETLITKGTLTGVIDRLRAKGLVERWEDAYDARRTLVALTDKGESLYSKAFPRHLRALKQRFEQVPPRDRIRAIRLLEDIQLAFSRQL